MALPKIIQLEVTTACQARCIFCPRTVLGERWLSAHLDWEVFSSILPFVHRGQLVHLQGWGEPLLHPRLWEMAEAIKRRGGRVSLTTNAMLLDKEACHQICRIGFELIAVSVAGARASTNDLLRKGCQLEKVCQNVSYLCSLKPRPKVHLIMQMMKPNMEELPELIDLAAELGVDKVIAPNLDYTPTPEVALLRAFSLSPNPHYVELTREAQYRASKRRIKLHIYPLTPNSKVEVCDADPIHNIWISVWGEVAPCAYLALPCHNHFPRIFWGKEEQLPRFYFGKITEGLDQVLKNEKASSFRQAFIYRLPLSRTDMGKLTQILAFPRSIPLEEREAFLKQRIEEALPPPPQPCLNCYKLYGL